MPWSIHSLYIISKCWNYKKLLIQFHLGMSHVRRQIRISELIFHTFWMQRRSVLAFVAAAAAAAAARWNLQMASGREISHTSCMCISMAFRLWHYKGNCIRTNTSGSALQLLLYWIMNPSNCIAFPSSLQMLDILPNPWRDWIFAVYFAQKITFLLLFPLHRL